MFLLALTFTVTTACAFLIHPHTLSVASFNVQNFGQKAIQAEPDKIMVLAKIVCRMDIIALQEVCDVETSIHNAIAGKVAELCPGKHISASSAAQSKTTRRESCMLFYDQEKVIFDESRNRDSNFLSRPVFQFKFHVRGYGKKDFFRPWRKAKNLEFQLLVSHLSPGKVHTGMRALDFIYRDIQSKNPDTHAIVLMGDLNAGYPFLPKVFQQDLRLLNSTFYMSPISDSMTTMASTVGDEKKPRPYDRILYDVKYHKYVINAHIWKNVYKGITRRPPTNYSDHYPVRFDLVLKHLGSSMPEYVPVPMTLQKEAQKTRARKVSSVQKAKTSSGQSKSSQVAALKVIKTSTKVKTATKKPPKRKTPSRPIIVEEPESEDEGDFNFDFDDEEDEKKVSKPYVHRIQKQQQVSDAQIWNSIKYGQDPNYDPTADEAEEEEDEN